MGCGERQEAENNVEEGYKERGSPVRGKRSTQLWPEMQPQASQRHHVHHPTYAPTSATPQAAETAEVPIGEVAESDETLGRPI